MAADFGSVLIFSIVDVLGLQLNRQVMSKSLMNGKNKTKLIYNKTTINLNKQI